MKRSRWTQCPVVQGTIPGGSPCAVPQRDTIGRHPAAMPTQIQIQPRLYRCRTHWRDVKGYNFRSLPKRRRIDPVGSTYENTTLRWSGHPLWPMSRRTAEQRPNGRGTGKGHRKTAPRTHGRGDHAGAPGGCQYVAAPQSAVEAPKTDPNGAAPSVSDPDMPSAVVEL